MRYHRISQRGRSRYKCYRCGCIFVTTDNFRPCTQCGEILNSYPIDNIDYLIYLGSKNDKIRRIKYQQ